MTTDLEVVIRKARPEDSSVLAGLMNAAGEGLPAYLWSRMAGPGEDVMAFGARRVARTEGGFSYVHAHVATTAAGDVAGMLLGYPLPDPYPPDALDDCPEVVRPLIELEALVPGSWYVNAVAVMPELRGRGAGHRLMALAERCAREAGTAALSLIVAEENRGAKRLYESLGYGEVGRRAIVPFDGCPHGGDWVMMRK